MNLILKWLADWSACARPHRVCLPRYFSGTGWDDRARNGEIPVALELVDRGDFHAETLRCRLVFSDSESGFSFFGRNSLSIERGFIYYSDLYTVEPRKDSREMLTFRSHRKNGKINVH